MKIVVQRCTNAKVDVDNKTIGKIENGLMLLVGFTDTDDSKTIDYMVNKVINLRIFDDEQGVMNKSLQDVSGSILSVSQFTLYGDATKGNRPSYVKASTSDKPIKLYEEFHNRLKEKNIHVETGKFGADMKVTLTNDGPITILLEK